MGKRHPSAEDEYDELHEHHDDHILDVKCLVGGSRTKERPRNGVQSRFRSALSFNHELHELEQQQRGGSEAPF